MRVPRLSLRAAIVAAVCFASAPSLATVSITYQLQDLVDVSPGEDRWQYKYLLTGSFTKFSGFEVEFDARSTAWIDPDPVAPNANWAVSTVPALPQVPANGLYSALALQPTASTSLSFEVTFVRKGSGVPGAQPFSVLDENFSLLQSGMTTPVPEPRAYVMLGVGLLMLVDRARRRAR